MKGEFDRELDDGGRGPSGTWETLLVQMDSTANAIGVACKPADRKKKINKAKDRMAELLTDMGKTLDKREPLGQLLVDKVKIALAKKAEMAEKGQKANMFQRREWKKKEDEWEKKRQVWSELAIGWQGTRHQHQRQPSKRVNASDTSTRPPPYAPPTPPPQSMYPTFYVDKRRSADYTTG